MTKRSIVHIEIPAADQQSAARFYADLFGWDTESVPGMDYTTFASGNVGGGFPTAGTMAQAGEVLVYLSSDDIDADLRKIESMGGKTVAPKMEIPNTGWFAIFTDPTGNKIGLFKSVDGQP